MLPPIWVAACASHSSRNGRFRKTAPVPDPAASAIGAAVTRVSPGGNAVGGNGADRGGHCGVAALLEAREPAFERPPLEQHVAVAGTAAEPDVGAEPVDEPDVSAARVTPTEPDDVAEKQL